MSEPIPSTTDPLWITVELWARFDKRLGRWVIGSPELDVWSSGKTPQESVERASEAITLFLEEASEAGSIREILRNARIELREKPEPPPTPGVFARLIKSLSYKPFLPAVFPVPRKAA
jgi:predicted RNase H-like HicB family nuclease